MQGLLLKVAPWFPRKPHSRVVYVCVRQQENELIMFLKDRYKPLTQDCTSKLTPRKRTTKELIVWGATKLIIRVFKHETGG